MNFTKSFSGISPRVLITTQQGNSNVAPHAEASQIPRERFIVRDAFSKNASQKWAQTPFRVVMNAGDLYLRQAEPGGANAVKSGVGHMRGLMSDSTQAGDGATGNQHYVYDSSDYTRFKRLTAKQKLYNDFTFGGTSYTPYGVLMAVRH
jgi:hypothetical protein